MDVFKLNMLWNAVGFIVDRNLRQTCIDCGGIAGGNNPLCRQHRGMRAAAADIFAPQTLVDRDRGVYLAHDGVGAAAEPTAPHATGV